MTAGARYTAVAIVLHWAIAAAILANLAVGWWMHQGAEGEVVGTGVVAAFQLHKSLGLTVLALSVLRLVWRLTHRPPPLPAAMPRWEQRAARATHWAFYLLMVIVPLSGWTYVSAQWWRDAPFNTPTLWFGLFKVPHLFDAGAMPLDQRKVVAARNLAAHAWLAWSMAALLALHVAAALRHHFVTRDAVLAGMAPRLGAGIVAAITVVVLALFLSYGRANLATAITSAPGGWTVDPASEIAFSGVHAGAPFRGRFTRWQADLRFNPLAASAVTVAATIETASATDGVPLHDEALPLRDWFDVSRYPHARFVATRISPKPGGGHTVEGALTIKDRVIAVPPLDLEVSNEAIVIGGRFTIDRAEANLGMESDPTADFVSRRIEIEVKVRATPP